MALDVHGVTGSSPVLSTMIAEHYRWNGEKASHLNGFGNFLFSKFLGNSIDEIAVGRGSNRVWTSAFPFSRGFLQPAPFFRGLRRRDFGKIEEKSFTKLWTLDCWFSRTKFSALFVCPKNQIGRQDWRLKMNEELTPQKERFLQEVEQKLLHRELDARLVWYRL